MTAAVEYAALAPEYVRRIARYVPGKPVEELAREYDLDPATIIKLASNENPLGMSPKAKAALTASITGTDLSRYPVFSNGSVWKLQGMWSNAAYLAGSGTPNSAGQAACIW